MPCYEINEMTLAEFKLKSKDILANALKALGYSINIVEDGIEAKSQFYGEFFFDLKNGNATYARNNANMFRRIKQEYSAQVITLAAKKKNWMLKKLNENKYKATKF